MTIKKPISMPMGTSSHLYPGCASERPSTVPTGPKPTFTPHRNSTSPAYVYAKPTITRRLCRF